MIKQRGEGNQNLSLTINPEPHKNMAIKNRNQTESGVEKWMVLRLIHSDEPKFKAEHLQSKYNSKKREVRLQFKPKSNNSESNYKGLSS